MRNLEKLSSISVFVFIKFGYSSWYVSILGLAENGAFLLRLISRMMTDNANLIVSTCTDLDVHGEYSEDEM